MQDINHKHKNNWVFNGKQKSETGAIQENYLPPLAWIRNLKHIKVKGTESPFSQSKYRAVK